MAGIADLQAAFGVATVAGSEQPEEAAFGWRTPESIKMFTMSRVCRLGANINDHPHVISASWTELDTDGVVCERMTNYADEFVVACPLHGEECRGHVRRCGVSSAMVLPISFAREDGTKFSEAAIWTRKLKTGEIDRWDYAKLLMKKVAGKSGIGRKECSGCRTPCTVRGVASPFRGPMGFMTMPKRYMERGVFMFKEDDGTFTTRKIKENDVVILGRCPSKSADSALPMKVMIGEDDAAVLGVPINVCSLNNTDFDGDEDWVFVPASNASIREAERRWVEVWEERGIVDFEVKVKKAAAAMGWEEESGLDPVMFSTLPLDEMVSENKMAIHDVCLLKPAVWDTITKAVKDPKTYTTAVTRNEEGINMTTLGRHSIAGPYVAMRNAAVIGTLIGRCCDRGVLLRPTSIGDIRVDGSNIKPGSCSNGLAKMLSSLFQKSVDTAKHGKTNATKTASEMLLTRAHTAIGIVNMTHGTDFKILNETGALRNTMRASMMWVSEAKNIPDVYTRAVQAVTFAAKVDGTDMTEDEIEAVALLVLVFSLKAGIGIVSENSLVNASKSIGIDWFTAMTASNISPLKSLHELPDICKCTSIMTVMGAILTGNMSWILGYCS
jgi:hypothetical protein